jgi:hypothetical protein
MHPVLEEIRERLLAKAREVQRTYKLPLDARWMMLTTNSDVYDFVFQCYNGPIFGEQILGMYGLTADGQAIPCYGISHLSLSVLQPLLREIPREDIILEGMGVLEKVLTVQS